MDISHAHKRMAAGAITGDVATQLASAYELRPSYVEADARIVQQWSDSDAQLLAYLEARHDWSSESEYAFFYVAELRRRLANSVEGMDLLP